MAQVSVLPKSRATIAQLVELWNKGVVVAVPTETAFGLLTDATNARAVAAVHHIKGRSAAKASALLMASQKQAEQYVRFTPVARRLAKKFWPGPLTLVLKAKTSLPRGVRVSGTVGVRVPKSAWLLQALRAFGRPLTATSANRAGKQTLYSSSAVLRSLGRHGLRYVVQAKLSRRATSTVVRCDKSGYSLLRLGAISESRIRAALGLKK